MTMTLVSTITVPAGGQAAIEFTGIPQTGQDLVVVLSARSNRAAAFDQLYLQFNADTTLSRYRFKSLMGFGSGVVSTEMISNFVPFIFTREQSTAGAIPAATSTASTHGNQQIYISNYSGTTGKSISLDSVGEQNATASGQEIIAGLYNNTTGITSIALTLNASFVQYSSASLYTISTTGATGATVA